MLTCIVSHVFWLVIGITLVIELIGNVVVFGYCLAVVPLPRWLRRIVFGNEVVAAIEVCHRLDLLLDLIDAVVDWLDFLVPRPVQFV